MWPFPLFYIFIHFNLRVPVVLVDCLVLPRVGLFFSLTTIIEAGLATYMFLDSRVAFSFGIQILKAQTKFLEERRDMETLLEKSI